MRLYLIGWIVNLDLLKAWLWSGGSTGIVTGPLPNGQLSMVNNHVCVGVLLNVGPTLCTNTSSLNLAYFLLSQVYCIHVGNEQ